MKPVNSRKLSSLLLALCVAAPLAGCAYGHSRRPSWGTSRSEQAVWKKDKDKRECHPSQYWDGERCKHKGKGKGARKHDD
ncbi:MAG: hypothetical protein L0Y66_14710 [Myxococcaceae bacterium]|nr:hypothetical protein [Myxococcaceae bacterium]MCI0669116.1 hypothetical protein [Myxococcaceae bacterium]